MSAGAENRHNQLPATDWSRETLLGKQRQTATSRAIAQWGRGPWQCCSLQRCCDMSSSPDKAGRINLVPLTAKSDRRHPAVGQRSPVQCVGGPASTARWSQSRQQREQQMHSLSMASGAQHRFGTRGWNGGCQLIRCLQTGFGRSQFPHFKRTQSPSVPSSRPGFPLITRGPEPLPNESEPRVLQSSLACRSPQTRGG